MITTDLTIFDMKSDNLSLSPVEATVIYAYGCKFHCQNCLYWADFERIVPYTISPSDCAKKIKDTDNKCVVLTGGNPLNQAGPFADMLEILKRESDSGIILYCGETEEELNKLIKEDSNVKRLMSMVDTAITGRYEMDKDVGNRYIGSNNQKVLFVTDRYISFKDMYGMSGREIVIRFGFTDRLFMGYSGVPSKAQEALFELLTTLVVNREYSTNASASYHNILQHGRETHLTSVLGEIVTIVSDGSNVNIRVPEIDPSSVESMASMIAEQLIMKYGREVYGSS